MYTKFFLRNYKNNIQHRFLKRKKIKRFFYEEHHVQSNFFVNSIENNKRIKASFICPMEFKESFKNSRAQVTISLGKEIHEGGKLVSTLGLVNSCFESCVIMLDDTIQWYTNYILKPDISPRILFQKAYEEGDNWISRNKNTLNMLTIPYEIVRWEDILLRSEFESLRLKVMTAYYQNPEYKKAIDENIEEFLARMEKNSSVPFNKERAFVLCLNYLLEECAGMITWAIKHKCQFEIYPSGRNKAMEATYKLFIEGNYINSLKPVSVRFSKKNIDSSYYQKVVEEPENNNAHFPRLNV